MGSSTNILINVGAKTGTAVSELRKVNTALKTQQGATSTWQKGIGKSMKLAGAAFAAVGVAAVAGIGLATRELIEMGKEAWEDKQQADKLQQTLENLGIPQSAIDKNADWIASMEIATNVSDGELRVAVGRLAAQTGDLTTAQEQVAIATDLAVGAGISQEKALKAVQSANDGSMESIRKYVKLQDTNKDGNISLKEALKATKKAYKGAAAAAADNDPWKRLKTLWGNLREALGQWLIPLLEELGDWFKNPTNQRKIREFTDKVAEFSRQAGEKAVEAIKEFIKWLKSPEGKRAMKDMRDLIIDIKDALQSMSKWFKDNGGAIRLLGAAISSQTGRFRILSSAIQVAVGWLQTLWSWLQKFVGNTVLGRITGIGRSATPAPVSLMSSGARTMSAGGGPVTVNVYGTDPMTTARAVKRALEGEDQRQGRPRGAPLALAW